MSQCQYWINGQRRCPERALAGNNYCQRHQVRLSALPGSLSLMASWEKYKHPTAIPARPSALGQAPEYFGIFTDQSNVLVGKEGIICLPGGHKHADRNGTNHALLLSLLANLSLELPLAGQVDVYEMRNGLGYLVKIVAPEQKWESFSLFYDCLATAAGISNGHLYVGEEPYYICYRDWQAPRGYDAVAGPVAIDTLMLTDESGQYHLPARDYEQLFLTELIMSMKPVVQLVGQKDDDIYLLLPRPLYPLVGRYLHSHHLEYRVSSLVDQAGQLRIMLCLAGCQSPEGERTLSRYVLSFLTGLPGCQAFQILAATDNRRLLVSRDACLPGNAEHLLELFPPDTFLLFSTDPELMNQCITPAPVFFESCDGLSFTCDSLPEAGIKTVVSPQKLELSIPLKLVFYKQPTRTTDALLLDNEELGWFSRFLYQVPHSIFSGCRLFRGHEFSVLLGDGSDDINLPFGLPLQRIQQGDFLIPLHTRITPDVSWSLLEAALELRGDHLTILTAEQFMELPLDGFLPLSRLLVSGKILMDVKLKVVVPDVVPELQWEVPDAMILESTDKAQSYPQPAAAMTPDGKADSDDSMVTIPASEEKEIFRQRAENLMQEGDCLAAAVCFSLAEMPWEAAQCYREAAQEAEKVKNPNSNNNE